MTRDEQIVNYRLSKLEEAVQTLAAGQEELKEFFIALKAYFKIFAALWSILAIAAAGILAKLLVG